jgi:crotonobetainyl-CoA:carnitine CoA-transferase CaiB-like acyl-CoA transferase
MGTGMWAALGTVSALLERERTGEGALVDTSLYETALGYVNYHLVGFWADGTVPQPQGTVFPMVAPYQVFPTGDGELMVAGGNDRLFALLCDVLGFPELVADACAIAASSSSSCPIGFASDRRQSGSSS